tara:strand:+ start:579 stop:830 length:252 start_codon:yes stop_codon:yes gene_type:complete
MSSSSVSRQVAVDMKTKKLERRDAIEKRNKPEDNKLQHQEIEIGGVSAETSSSDIPVISQEKTVKPKAKKKAATKKKQSAKKA